MLEERNYGQKRMADMGTRGNNCVGTRLESRMEDLSTGTR